MKWILDLFKWQKAGFLVALAILVPGTNLATTAPMHRIDLLIKGGSANNFRGDEVLNRTGNNQQVSLPVRRNGKLFVRVQNEGDVPDTFKVRGPRSGRYFRLKFFHAGENVTGAMRNGNLITPEVPAMDVLTPDIVVKVHVKRKARGTGMTRTIKIKGQSVGAPVGDGTDVVKSKLRAR